MTDTRSDFNPQGQPQAGLFDVGGGVPDIFAYPFSPGFKKAGTSAEAAAAIAPLHKTLKVKALEKIREQPGTADEIATRLGKSVLSVRPAVSALMALGEIRETGERRRNDSGKFASVVEAVS